MPVMPITLSMSTILTIRKIGLPTWIPGMGERVRRVNPLDSELLPVALVAQSIPRDNAAVRGLIEGANAATRRADAMLGRA